MQWAVPHPLTLLIGGPDDRVISPYFEVLIGDNLFGRLERELFEGEHVVRGVAPKPKHEEFGEEREISSSDRFLLKDAVALRKFEGDASLDLEEELTIFAQGADHDFSILDWSPRGRKRLNPGIENCGYQVEKGVKPCKLTHLDTWWSAGRYRCEFIHSNLPGWHVVI